MIELRYGLLCGALVLAAAPARGVAEPAANTAKARQLVEDGIAAQDRRDYETAIQKYQEAYRLKPHPTLIYNLAQVHRLAGHDANARTLYQRYLSEVPDGDLADKARGFVAEIDARHPVAPPPAPVDRTLAPAPDIVVPPPPPPAPEPAAPGGHDLRVAGVAVGAAGVVALGVGVGFWIHSNSLNDRFTQRYMASGPEAAQSLKDAGFRANKIAWATGITGAVLIGGGAGLFWWSYRRDRPSDSVAVAPLISDHVAGVAVAGSLW